MGSALLPPGHPHRLVTTSIITCGSPLGSLILNPISAKLIYHYGWRVAYRILSVVMAVLGCGCSMAFFIKIYKSKSQSNSSVQSLVTKEEDGEIKNSNSKHCSIFCERISISLW